MTHHERIHLMKEVYKHIHAADTVCTQPAALTHIQRAKELFNVIANDEGVLLTRGEVD